MPETVQTLVRIASAAILAAGIVTTASSPAAADASGSTGASECDGSYCAQVTYSGTAAPSGGGGGGNAVNYVRPDCWYEPWGTPKKVMQEIQEYYDLGHFSGAESILLYGSYEDFEKAAKEANADATWYRLDCSIDFSDPKAIDYAGEAVNLYPGQPMARMARLLPNGTPPPPALVDPETLRDAAFAALDIPEPTISRNPEATARAATLVNLDTYFWADAYRDSWDITASVGPVSATVVATSQGWTVTSPAGGSSCTQEQFTTPYAPGVSPSAGCTISFGRASLGYPDGFPVEAIATWGATWTGVPGPSAPQSLPSVTTSATVNVPVLESQALVNDVS